MIDDGPDVVWTWILPATWEDGYITERPGFAFYSEAGPFPRFNQGKIKALGSEGWKVRLDMFFFPWSVSVSRPGICYSTVVQNTESCVFLRHGRGINSLYWIG